MAIVLDEITRNGKKAKGRIELIRHLKGNKITRDQAIRAKCYDCMGYFADGVQDCEVAECSLYPFMPYKGKAGEHD